VRFGSIAKSISSAVEKQMFVDMTRTLFESQATALPVERQSVYQPQNPQIAGRQ
jgi:hypothetical protein